ncbi:hypothetical protein GCM10008014_42630 [Paenibacillus silvae]|uniref:Glycosyltransferase 2-like domain-containing protein n=1 Tax=Paenibacillus silvae TaxID=1325358 RepID=A0ABQ1ZIL9_9BACL|nr:glycosyltransferase [Paenibacillus silvae]GGH64343.1 hypothetical protein GCM10008014_42630 [Paenibacillus silvae]
MKNNESFDPGKTLEQKLMEIQETIHTKHADDIFHEYNSLVAEVEKNIVLIDISLAAMIYSSFANFLFNVSEYEYFFTTLIKAQEYGYPSEEVESFLYAAFIEPNIPEFERNYEENIRFLQIHNNLHVDSIPLFQDLPYWMLPTGTESEFYLYNRMNKRIEERIVLFKYESLQKLPTIDALADYLVMVNWNWSNTLTCTQAIKINNKKSYIVVNEIDKFLSCLQGRLLDAGLISDTVITDNISKLDVYFSDSSIRLPRNIIDLTRNQELVEKYINGWHKFRLSEENRNGSHILLSICIPSHNRGNRAYENILALMQSYYDEEIEFVLSNNGTENDTKNFYARINELQDSRIKYFEFEENQGFAINCCKVCEMASGKFILLLSDEDMIDLDSLHLIMQQLDESSDSLAILKPSISNQIPLGDIIKTAGANALEQFMLTSNYMSGFTMNNALLRQYEGIEYIKNNLDNQACYYYPHMYWEMLLAQYGTVVSKSIVLIQAGSEEKTSFSQRRIGNNSVKIRHYSTIEGRLEQHEGFAKIIKELEISKDNSNFHRMMYIQLCSKTLFLTSLAINACYSNTDVNTDDISMQVFHFIADINFYKLYVSTSEETWATDSRHITSIYENWKRNYLKKT